MTLFPIDLSSSRVKVVVLNYKLFIQVRMYLVALIYARFFKFLLCFHLLQNNPSMLLERKWHLLPHWLQKGFAPPPFHQLFQLFIVIFIPWLVPVMIGIKICFAIKWIWILTLYLLSIQYYDPIKLGFCLVWLDQTKCIKFDLKFNLVWCSFFTWRKHIELSIFYLYNFWHA